jgi:tetratricopeptide (TPR) repeat protein
MAATLIGLSFAASSCTKAAKASRHSQRADQYFKDGEYDKAKIEYMNVLQVSGPNAKAIQRLGHIWYEQGAWLKAAPFLLRARELTPDQGENRLRLARVFARVGQLDEAKQELNAVLQQSPENGEALLVLSDLVRTPEEIASVEQKLQEFSDKKTAFYQLALANIALRKEDRPAAEEAVRQALVYGPDSPEAHLGAGFLYLLQKKVPEAEGAFQKAAELSPLRSDARIKYAEFLAQVGQSQKAVEFLKGLTNKAPDFLPAWTLLGHLALNEKKYDEALTALNNVFSRDGDNVDARLLRSEAWLAKGETKRALEDLERLDQTYSGIPTIKYHLACAHLQNNNVAQATTLLEQAVALNPAYAEATILLAEVNIRSGKSQAAVKLLEDMRKIRPDVPRLQRLLADVYRNVGRLDDAASLFREEIKNMPNSAESHLFLGVILRQKGDNGEARALFEKTIALAPENLHPVIQLVEMDIAEKRYDDASHRVAERMQRHPDSAALKLLEAKIYAAQRQWDRAEAVLLQALALKSDMPEAYELLVSVYIEANQLPKAVGQLEAFLAKAPNNAGALMALGSLYSRVQDFGKARDTYERLIAVAPDWPMALNNLAYIYGERLGELDRALELAKKARSLASQDPSIADTLGWILFKRGDHQQAVSLLRESAGKLPNRPEVQFHFGMASYAMGDIETARKAFETALASPTEFPEKEDVRRRLKLLGDKTAGVSPAVSVSDLEAMLKQQPNDVIALLRLGEELEKQSLFAKAADAYAKALEFNPKLLAATLKLAQLHAGPLQNNTRALEFAKKARELAPLDVEVTGVLGAIAYRIGDYAWAYSLLQETVRQRKGDPKVLHDFGWAAYSVGKVGEAERTMEEALGANPEAATAKEIQSFLAMVKVERDKASLAGAEPEIQRLLKADPTYAPALMALAALQSHRGNTQDAIGTYEGLLKRLPDFAPAQKKLSALYLIDPSKRAAAYDLAIQARKTIVDDPELEQTLAELGYHRKEYARTIQLLQASARSQPLSPRGLFFLGMAHFQLKHPSEAKEALNRALAAGLEDSLAAEARRVMGELE